MSHCGYEVMCLCCCVVCPCLQVLMASTGVGVELACEGTTLAFSVKVLA